MARYTYIFKLLVAGISVGITNYTVAGGFVLPIGDNMPPDSVSVKNISLERTGASSWPNQFNKVCGIDVGAAYDQRLSLYLAQDFLKGRSCWGYTTSGRTDPESISQDAAALIAAGPIVNKRPYDGQVGQPGFCHVRVYWNISDNVYAYAQTDVCSLHEAPAVCTMTYPYDIVHRDGVVGDVKSEQTSSVQVYCNKPTSLHVSVENTNLSLRAEQEVIRSRFYVGGVGQSSTNTTASPNVTIPVYSVINTKATSVGEYRGSIVVTVGWD